PKPQTIHCRAFPEMCRRRFPMLFDSAFGRHHTCWSLSFSRQRSILGRYSSRKRRRASAMKDSETPAVPESACEVVMPRTYRHSTAGVNIRRTEYWVSLMYDKL